MTSPLELTILSLIWHHPGVLEAQDLSPTALDIMQTAGYLTVDAGKRLWATPDGLAKLQEAGVTPCAVRGDIPKGMIGAKWKRARRIAKKEEG